MNCVRFVVLGAQRIKIIIFLLEQYIIIKNHGNSMIIKKQLFAYANASIFRFFHGSS